MLPDTQCRTAKPRVLIMQGINPAHNRQLALIKRGQENATTFETLQRHGWP